MIPVHRVAAVFFGGLCILGACGCGPGGSATYSISGTITGDIQRGVTITISGANADAVTTDSSGDYVLTGLGGGENIVTPSRSGYAFTPSSRTVTLSAVSISGADFVSQDDSGLPVNTVHPSSVVRLVFVHHTVGNDWLATGTGNLGSNLGSNNYCVRDTYFGWDAPQNNGIGGFTDIGDWYTWFADTTLQGNGIARRANIAGALFTTDNQNAAYTPIADPGGENAIILFKSDFPNSSVRNDNSHPPEDLYGRPFSSDAHTLGNCEEVYRQILAYFKTRTTKMFVVVTAPPLVQSATIASHAANARELDDWLVGEWLAEGVWENKNVYVFDLFNVLTHAGNHHRVSGGRIEHVVDPASTDYAAYPTVDSHPSAAGHQKATAELVPLLNAYYHRWQKYLGNE